VSGDGNGVDLAAGINIRVGENGGRAGCESCDRGEEGKLSRTGVRAVIANDDLIDRCRRAGVQVDGEAVVVVVRDGGGEVGAFLPTIGVVRATSVQGDTSTTRKGATGDVRIDRHASDAARFSAGLKGDQGLGVRGAGHEGRQREHATQDGFQTHISLLLQEAVMTKTQLKHSSTPKVVDVRCSRRRALSERRINLFARVTADCQVVQWSEKRETLWAPRDIGRQYRQSPPRQAGSGHLYEVIT